MMRLQEASGYFDRTPIIDPYTGRTLFYGQVDPFDDSKRDSTTAYRRILSVAPGTDTPVRGVVSVLGSNWILGVREVDGLGEAHREKYVLHPATVKASISRLPGLLSGDTPTSAWADVAWFKDGREESVSSRQVPMYTAYLHPSTVLQEYDVISAGGRTFLVSNPHAHASGMLEATCVRLDSSVVGAVMGSRAYDPVQGKYVSNVTTVVKCLQVRWQSLYLYRSQADTKFAEGDCALVLPSGTSISTKDTLTVGAVVWGVISVEPLAGAVVAHGRPL